MELVEKMQHICCVYIENEYFLDTTCYNTEREMCGKAKHFKFTKLSGIIIQWNKF